ncbi:Probable RNA-directed DNA polymerase from transposon BS [Eumeta japonica]|uniref:Probable RNA-directed DNA polymerase from transposon BS n=1 Tax=Eumeta variegata TaxID=151549 RepID=A0A4C1ZUV0_EUMVA|nr:Probable RNA-directed DNA polymerase from transposon BS [Eumeta japonica]
MLFPTVLSLLVAIFNACIKNCYFPPAWKEAEVIGIHKPGKPRDLPASYRPISLLSAHSCPQQVFRLVEYVSEAFKTKQKTVAVFLDVAKAFDRVWHASLVYKLYSLQVPDRLILIIQNFLSNRHSTCRHERTHSTRRLIRARVPQGSALSPLLYSAYTNDIPRPTSGVQLALFADDTALFFRSRTRRSIFRHLPRSIDELGRIEAILRHRGITPQCAPSRGGAAVDYQPPPPTYFIRRPRNVLIDPPDALTAAVDSLNDVNDTVFPLVRSSTYIPYSTRPLLTAPGRAGGTETDP